MWYKKREIMSSIDTFFYAGQIDLRTEIAEDIEMSLVQPKRSIPYFRAYGAGVSEYENQPITFDMMIRLRYEIALWLAKRNSYVSNGDNGTPDRRAVTSQMAITVNRSENGLDIDVPFLALFDLTDKNSVTIPLGA
jgi:hypothetical protein